MKYTQLALTLSMIGTAYAMELDNLETGKNNRPSTDIVKAIRSGRCSELDKLLSPHTRSGAQPRIGTVQNLEQLTSALGFTELELSDQEAKLAKGALHHITERFKERYGPIVVPLASTGLTITAFILTLYNRIQSNDLTDREKDVYLGGLITLAGGGIHNVWNTWKQGNKGYTDHRQRKKVDKLKNSEKWLLAMKEIQGLKATMAASGIAPIEEATIATTAVLEKEASDGQLSKLVIGDGADIANDTDNATAPDNNNNDADGDSANDDRAKGKEEAGTAAPLAVQKINSSNDEDSDR